MRWGPELKYVYNVNGERLEGHNLQSGAGWFFIQEEALLR
jgi:hypothetical protein